MKDTPHLLITPHLRAVNMRMSKVGKLEQSWPGGPVYRPRWKNHIDKAGAALQPSAMEAALSRLRSGT